MTTYFLTQWLTVLTYSIWIPFHPRISLYQKPQGSWTNGKSVSLCRKVNVLVIYTRSNHEYALPKPTAMLIVLTGSFGQLYNYTHGSCSTTYQKAPWHQENRFCQWRQVNVLAILLDKTMNTQSEPTVVAYSAVWLQPNTCPPVGYAIPVTTRLFNTWKTSIAINIS